MCLIEVLEWENREKAKFEKDNSGELSKIGEKIQVPILGDSVNFKQD